MEINMYSGNLNSHNGLQLNLKDFNDNEKLYKFLYLTQNSIFFFLWNFSHTYLDNCVINIQWKFQVSNDVTYSVITK